MKLQREFWMLLILNILFAIFESVFYDHAKKVWLITT